MDIRILLSNYKLPLICAGIGLLLGVLIFTLGFFKTLILVILSVIGFLVGLYLKKESLV